MPNEQQTKIIKALLNIMEAEQDMVRNSLYSEKFPEYKDVYLKMCQDSGKIIQVNLVAMADAIELPRNEMPGIYPENFNLEIN